MSAIRDQDKGILENGFHPLGVGDHVRRDVALVELHPVLGLDLGLERLRLLDRNHAVLTNLLHSLGDELADLRIVGRDRRDLGNLLFGIDVLLERLHFLNRDLDCLLDAVLDQQRVAAGGHVSQTLADDRLREHRRGSRAVARDIVGLRGDFLDELGPHVLEHVGQFDLFGNGHAVVGDRRRAEFLVEHDVAAFGAERHLYGIGEDVRTALERAARAFIEYELLCSHYKLLNSLNAGRHFVDEGENVFFGDDEVLRTIDLDFTTGILAIEHAIADLDMHI